MHPTTSRHESKPIRAALYARVSTDHQPRTISYSVAGVCRAEGLDMHPGSMSGNLRDEGEPARAQSADGRREGRTARPGDRGAPTDWAGR